MFKTDCLLISYPMLVYSKSFLEATFLSNISFSCYHGSSHSANILGADVLARVHFAIVNNTLPWVVGSFRSLLTVLIIVLLSLVLGFPSPDFSIPLSLPLVESFLSYQFFVRFTLLFGLHLLIQSFFPFLLLLRNLLNQF